MPRRFGIGAYGVGPYSADSLVPLFTIKIVASSSVSAAGRLLWATIPVPPCEPWPPIPGLPPIWPPIGIEDCAPWPPATWSPSLVLESPAGNEWGIAVDDSGALSLQLQPVWRPIAGGPCVAWPSLAEPKVVLESPGEAEWEIAVADTGALSMRLVRAPIVAPACGPWPALPGAPPIWAGIEAEDDDWTPPSGVLPAWQPIAAAPCNGWAMA